MLVAATLISIVQGVYLVRGVRANGASGQNALPQEPVVRL